MANSNKPSGFVPVKYQNGAAWDGRGTMYFISKNSSNAIRVGDLVVLGATAANADTAHGLQQVDLAASGNTVIGAVVGIGTQYAGPYVDPTNLTLNYAPATKTQNYYALVADDPKIIFEAQEIGTGTNFTSAHTSANCKFKVQAPSTGITISGWGLDIGTTPAATNTYDIKLMGLVQRYDNGAWNTFGAYAKWLCMLNLHSYSSTTGVLAS